MKTPVDEYLERQEIFKICIKDTESYIKWMKNKTGLARHKARDKIRDARKAMEMFNWMKEEDSLPWEPGPTYKLDELPVIASMQYAKTIH